jgi:cysteine synthase
MIDLTINEKQIESTVQQCRERDILIPTFEQMKDPTRAPQAIKERLKQTGLWDVSPANLFRITWKNEPKASGGLFGGVNYMVLPSEITGIEAPIVCLVGKWFPTGAHKVGASFGCLVPRLVTGQFDPKKQKAVWPSTGNYCRGGAYDSALMGCKSIAILPEEMSKERFEWLNKIAGEVIATPGCESNVKEIYDKCWELRESRGDDIMIFNQFDEMGNHLWHYEITGHAMEEVLKKIMKEGDRYAGVVLTTGSAGTIGCGDYLKTIYPTSKIAAGEALQCPTLLMNGFGGHRIEGIGDKHVPWIHNIRNTDMVIAADDEDCMNILRLFNEEEGHKYLRKRGVKDDMIANLPLMGISGIGNMVCAIKFAKYYELTKKDIVLTVCTDSMELYGSRIRELREQYGAYSELTASKDYHSHLQGLKIDYTLELGHYERKRVHNLKYYTWIEQQKSSLDELNAQWYDYPDYWQRIHRQVKDIDKLINQFNERTGVLKKLEAQPVGK